MYKFLKKRKIGKVILEIDHIFSFFVDYEDFKRKIAAMYKPNW